MKLKVTALSRGFKPGRGCKDALRMVQNNLSEGFTWVVDADLKSYFDTIPHDKLMTRIKEKIADGNILRIIEDYLKAGILDGLNEWTPTEGTPQGAVISPLLANIYLHPLDKQMKELGIRMVRYVDDFVLMCKSQKEAQHAFNMMSKWIEQNGLVLHPDKTHIGDCTQEGQGFEFLGYRFESGKRHVRKKSLTKFKDNIRNKTKRNNALSLPKIIEDLNRSLKGWFEYFKHAHHWTFGSIDAWIRRRLRAVLVRRNKGKGMGRSLHNHLSWPNAYFAKAGLFSLKTAHGSSLREFAAKRTQYLFEAEHHG